MQREVTPYRTTDPVLVNRLLNLENRLKIARINNLQFWTDQTGWGLKSRLHVRLLLSLHSTTTMTPKDALEDPGKKKSFSRHWSRHHHYTGSLYILLGIITHRLPLTTCMLLTFLINREENCLLLWTPSEGSYLSPSRLSCLQTYYMKSISVLLFRYLLLLFQNLRCGPTVGSPRSSSTSYSFGKTTTSQIISFRKKLFVKSVYFDDENHKIRKIHEKTKKNVKNNTSIGMRSQA